MEKQPFRHTVRVGYADTDQGGIAHHSVYARWFEEARVAFLRESGIDFRKLEQEHKTSLVVVTMTIGYKKPAFFDDVLEIETSISKLGNASMVFEYRVVRKGGLNETLLGTAEIRLASFHLERKRPCAFLPDFVEPLRDAV